MENPLADRGPGGGPGCPHPRWCPSKAGRPVVCTPRDWGPALPPRETSVPRCTPPFHCLTFHSTPSRDYKCWGADTSPESSDRTR